MPLNSQQIIILRKKIVIEKHNDVGIAGRSDYCVALGGSPSSPNEYFDRQGRLP